MFSKTPKKQSFIDRTEKTRADAPKILLSSDSHTVSLVNSLPLPCQENSLSCVLPDSGIISMTLSDHVCVWDYNNVSEFTPPFI